MKTKTIQLALVLILFALLVQQTIARADCDDPRTSPIQPPWPESPLVCIEAPKPEREATKPIAVDAEQARRGECIARARAWGASENNCRY